MSATSLPRIRFFAFPQSRLSICPGDQFGGDTASIVHEVEPFQLEGRDADLRQRGSQRAVVVVEGATVRPFLTETITMLVIGLILSVFGIGFLCWLLFTLAVYALPFFFGMTAAFAAYHTGAGVVGAILVGVLAGAVALAAGQFLFAIVRSPLLRGAIAFLYAAPAAVAGYHATLGLAHIGVPSTIWCQVFAVVGSICVGATAFVRVAAMAGPPVAGQAASSGSSRPTLTATTR